MWATATVGQLTAKKKMQEMLVTGSLGAVQSVLHTKTFSKVTGYVENENVVNIFVYAAVFACSLEDRD